MRLDFHFKPDDVAFIEKELAYLESKYRNCWQTPWTAPDNYYASEGFWLGSTHRMCLRSHQSGWTERQGHIAAQTIRLRCAELFNNPDGLATAFIDHPVILAIMESAELDETLPPPSLSRTTISL